LCIGAADPQWKDDAGIKNFDAFLANVTPTAIAPIPR
jgi:hypothetical protein